MIREDLAADFEIYPDNQVAYDLFADLRTQWRIGMAGPTGLDYNILFHKMDRMKLSEDDYTDLEQCIRIMEYEALDHMNSQKQQ